MGFVNPEQELVIKLVDLIYPRSTATYKRNLIHRRLSWSSRGYNFFMELEGTPPKLPMAIFGLPEARSTIILNRKRKRYDHDKVKEIVKEFLDKMGVKY